MIILIFYRLEKLFFSFNFFYPRGQETKIYPLKMNYFCRTIVTGIWPFDVTYFWSVTNLIELKLLKMNDNFCR